MYQRGGDIYIKEIPLRAGHGVALEPHSGREAPPGRVEGNHGRVPHRGGMGNPMPDPLPGGDYSVGTSGAGYFFSGVLPLMKMASCLSFQTPVFRFS